MAASAAFAAEDSPPSGNLERMKACAAQAEKVMRRPDMQMFNLLQNHYSPKYERCFMRTSHVLSNRVSQIFLRDAFEGINLTSTTWYYTVHDSGKSRDCSIEGRTKPCAEVDSYIDEHMTH